MKIQEYDIDKLLKELDDDDKKNNEHREKAITNAIAKFTLRKEINVKLKELQKELTELQCQTF